MRATTSDVCRALGAGEPLRGGGGLITPADFSKRDVGREFYVRASAGKRRNFAFEISSTFFEQVRLIDVVFD